MRDIIGGILFVQTPIKLLKLKTKNKGKRLFYVSLYFTENILVVPEIFFFTTVLLYSLLDLEFSARVKHALVEPTYSVIFVH